jgi:hypothetical protein
MIFNGLHIAEGVEPRNARQFSPGKVALRRSWFAEQAGE